MDMTRAQSLIHQLLGLMKEKGGSDLFITAGFAPAIKFSGKLTPVSKSILSAEESEALVHALMNAAQLTEFNTTHECNFAVSPQGIGRFRVSAFMQQTKAGMVALHKAGFNLLLQVHDEIALSVNSRDEAREAADIMANAVRLEVPSRVDVEVGPSWGEAA